MSFLRPNAVAVMRRYAEPAIFAGLLAVFAWLAAGKLGMGQWFLAAVFAALGAICALGFVNALLRAHVKSPGTAKGVVIVDERRIGYFGPDNGGFIDLADLVSLELRAGVWRLSSGQGEVIDIPSTAPKADELLDLFATLPGVSLVTLHSALMRPGSDVDLVWARPN